MSSAALIGASLAVPMAGAVLILMSDARPNQREGATLVTAGVLFACVMALLPRVLAGERPTLTLLEPVAGL
ncbi:MAG: monovalent cation/H+ antiporter subunit D family protein, partial [Planctomycetes bacterium]|nr:monovalent cation/H+ antiporter subunit D family protein [Planctomycetota bacterium]